MRWYDLIIIKSYISNISYIVAIRIQAMCMTCIVEFLSLLYIYISTTKSFPSYSYYSEAVQLWTLTRYYPAINGEADTDLIFGHFGVPILFMYIFETVTYEGNNINNNWNNTELLKTETRDRIAKI